MGGKYAEDKQSRLDLLARLEGSELINIEIHFTNRFDIIKRSVYYSGGDLPKAVEKENGL